MKCVYKDNLDVDQLVVELQTLKAISQNENVICFEDLRQHMQNRPSEDFVLIAKVINII